MGTLNEIMVLNESEIFILILIIFIYIYEDELYVSKFLFGTDHIKGINNQEFDIYQSTRQFLMHVLNIPIFLKLTNVKFIIYNFIEIY